MILQALAGLYDRLAADPDSGIAPLGFQRQEIPFVIVLDRDGRCVGIDDTRTGEGKKRRGRSFLVPRGVKRSGKNAWQVAQLLWDNLDYVAGYNLDDPETARKKRESFLLRIEKDFGEIVDDEGVGAVLQHLRAPRIDELTSHPSWKDVTETTGNLSFRFAGDMTLICGRPMVFQTVLRSSNVAEGDVMQCLVSGASGPARRLHSPIKGVRNAQTTGGDIVSFNLSAFESYGREQGFNAPVGATAEFAYSTALNTLLGRDSRRKIQVGDATTVFWSEKQTSLETIFGDLFDPPKDDPNAGTDAVKALFTAPETGAPPPEDDLTRFYVLGLAPNAARLAVRFWHARTVAEVVRSLRQHFDDIAIVHGPNEQENLPLWRLLAATVLNGESKNLPPTLAGETMKAVLDGTPYPRTLLAAAIRRVRAERAVTYPRAALIKAVLARAARRNDLTKEVGMALDRENTNVGYRLGRFFALLERCQEAVSPGLNATIGDRFFGSASGTPVVAFPLLIRLNRNHLKKLKQEKSGYAVNLEKEIQEIIDGIVGKFPPHLDLDNQGRFAIGYYHQRQNFFKKKDKQEEEEA